MKTVIPSLAAIVVILGLTIGGKKLLEKYAPEAEKNAYVERIPVVETRVVKGGDVEVSLTSEGVVETRRDTLLSAEVAGRIVFVNSGFEVGATFQEGAVIARIDPVNYQAAVAQSKSTLAEARLALVQESARAEQAARDWGKIGGGQPASDLVLRVPFLKSAQARVEAAEAGLQKAEEDLKRTEIRAPFDCRVRTVSLNVGATVAPGGQLGTIYDHRNLLIRLPFTLADYAQIAREPEITLFTTIGGVRYEWVGEMLWDLGEVDRQTLSAYVLARIVEREGGGEKFALPPPGVFLKAAVKGSPMRGVVKVPRSAVRGRDQVYVLSEKMTLEDRTLTIARSSADWVFATEGIADGEKVIMTKIELPVEGMTLEEAKVKEPSLD